MKKHIVCFGDSNTHGYCADPADCAEGGDRFNEAERWTRILEKKLGNDFLILEEGLSGRTTVFDDPLEEHLAGIDAIYSVLRTHEPVDLLVVMLGTNDAKCFLNQNADTITMGMERLLRKAVSVDCWREKPNILLIAPPHIRPCIREHRFFSLMGEGALEKTRGLAVRYEKLAEAMGFHFLDAEGIAEFNQVDGMHLTALGHAQLAQALAERIPGMV